MKTTLLILVALCVAVSGYAAPGTLWQQEGTAADGPAGINAAAASGRSQADDSAYNWTNWKWQFGSASSKAVYQGDQGELEYTSGPDNPMTLKVEADIEMYFNQTIANNNVYFHIGEALSATAPDKTAVVTGSFASNNGQYVGITFPQGTKVAADFELGTGRIIGGMKSVNHSYGTQTKSMDMWLKMGWTKTAPTAGTFSDFQLPGSFGTGSHSTIPDTLWWLVDGGAAGAYDLQWQIVLDVKPFQDDGDYYLDPEFVVAPVL